ncbi:hypothetical protein WDU94_012856 [Cyamophila willieti]
MDRKNTLRGFGLSLARKSLDNLKSIARTLKNANHVVGGETRMFSTLVKNPNMEYSTVCRHTHYNTFHEQFECITKRLRQLQRTADGKNNVLHRMIFTYSEKLYAVENMHREIDALIGNHDPIEMTVIKLDAWLERHLTKSYSRHMQHVNQLPEYKHQAELVVEEINRVKQLPIVKPIQILVSNFEIEMYKKQIPTMIKEKQNRQKEENRSRIAAKNAAFDEHVIVEDCLKRFSKLKTKFEDVDKKLKNKMNRYNRLLEKINILENLKTKQSVRDKTGFCEIITVNAKIAKNKETIQCLKHKLKKMNAKKIMKMTLSPKKQYQEHYSNMPIREIRRVNLRKNDQASLSS